MQDQIPWGLGIDYKLRLRCCSSRPTTTAPKPQLKFSAKMRSQLLPVSLFILLSHLAAPAWSAASLVPPSTFADPPSSTPTLSGSATGSQSASLTGSASTSKPTGSASVNASSAATPTTTQFPPLGDVPTCGVQCKWRAQNQT